MAGVEAKRGIPRRDLIKIAWRGTQLVVIAGALGFNVESPVQAEEPQPGQLTPMSPEDAEKRAKREYYEKALTKY